MNATRRTRRWGIAWLSLVIAIALHVTDEALTGFLPLYNSSVESIRAVVPWLPLPTFSFPVWLGGLSAGIVLLLALSPLVFAGRRIFRPISYFLGVLMILNALGHIGASVYTSDTERGERIAQLVVASYERVVLEPQAELEKTSRGAGGFGHTGQH